MAAINLTTGWRIPTVADQDDSVGTPPNGEWDFETSILTDVPAFGKTNAETFTYAQIDQESLLRHAKLIVDGAITGTDKGADQVINTNPDLIVGGAADLWGTGVTAAQVRESDFGVAVAYGFEDFSVPTPPADYSYYLIGTGYGFDEVVPESTTIVGVEAQLDHMNNNLGGGVDRVEMNTMRMRITYSYEPTVIGGGESGGFVFVGQDEYTDMKKDFRVRAFNGKNEYVGDYDDVKNFPTFTLEMNNLLSSMQLDFARSEGVLQPNNPAVLATDDDEIITTDDDIPIAAELYPPVGIGEGTNLDVNYNVEIDVMYGHYEPLLTEDGQPLYTEDDELIQVPVGAPNGRTMFSGFIDEDSSSFNENDEAISALVLSHSHELKDIMLETDDTVITGFTDWDGQSTLGIAGGGPTDLTRLGQSFTQVGTVPVSRIQLLARTWDVSDIEVTLTLKTGAPNASGTVLATKKVRIAGDIDLGFRAIDFAFNSPITLTNGTVYSFLLDVNYSKSGGGAIYPVEFAWGTGYTGGVAYYIVAKKSTWTNSGGDLWFQIIEPGGDTTVAYNNMRPSDMAKKIINFARSRGARIFYDESSIQDTGAGSEVSIEFKTNTCLEALDAIPKLAPANWYQYCDPGDTRYYLQERGTTPDFYLTKRGNVNSGTIKRSLSRMVNDVYFAGGGDPALLVREQDTDSIEDWRRKLSKENDTRVTDATSGRLIARSKIDSNPVPPHYGTAKMMDKQGFPYTEEVTLGSIAGFIDWGYRIDALNLQVAKFTYNYTNPLDLDLEIPLTKPERRVVEVLKALDLLEQKNNASSPS